MPKNRNTGIEISDINISKVEYALKRTKKGQTLPEIAIGLKKYVWLISEFNDKEMNVLEDERGRQFQELYTDFFELFGRGLNEEQKSDACSKYYKVMQSYRENLELKQKCMETNNDVVFEMVLQCLYPIQKSVESSFGSKLLSMINPNRPVWDEFVRKNLKMSLIRGNTHEIRIENAVTTYSCLREKYKNFFNKDKAIAKEWIELFDNSPDIKPIIKEAKTKNVEITKVKKIDLILWQIREK